MMRPGLRSRSRRSAAFPLLACALIAGVVVAKPRLATEENPFNLIWHFGDETYGAARREKAIESGDALLSFLQSIFHGISVDESSSPLFAKISERLQNFDIEGVYRALPEREEGHGALLRGGVVDRGYLLSLREVSDVSPWRQGTERLGDFELDLSLSAPRRPELPRYGVSGAGRISTGGIAPDEMSAVAEGFLERLGRRYPTEDLDKELLCVRKSFLNLGKEDQRLLFVVKTFLPRCFGRIERYVDFRSLVGHGQAGNGSSFFDLDFKLRIDKVGEDYPVLGGYLDDLTGIGSVVALFKDLKGNRLFKVEFDTRGMHGRVQMMLRDGAIVRCDDRWNPVEAKEIRLTSLRSFSGLWDVDLMINFSGLIFSVEDISLLSRFRRRKGDVSIRTYFQEKPTISEVSGAAYGVFPSWLIDVVIPGNLQELLDEFLAAAAEGIDGDGTEVAVYARRVENGGTSELVAEVSTCVAHSGFLASVSEIFGDLVVPTEEERAAMWRFASDAFDDFHQDYLDFRAISGQ